MLSDETPGGIEHADPVVDAALQREFVRRDDIDIVPISATDWAEGGTSTADALTIAQALVAHGADAGSPFCTASELDHGPELIALRRVLQLGLLR